MILALTVPAGHEHVIWCVAFSADCALLASGSWDNVRLWDAGTGQLLHLLQGLPRPIFLKFIGITPTSLVYLILKEP